MHSLRTIAVCLLPLIAAFAPRALAQRYPGKTWEVKQPAEVGLDAKQLTEVSDYIGGFGCVVRDGALVFSWGDPHKRADVASACKPWFTHLLFVAIEQGKLKSIDEPLTAVEPRLEPLNARLGYKDREIRWRHLASQTSCYGVEERPGQAYDYSDFNMAMFFDSLLVGIYKSSGERSTPDVLRPLVTDVIECEDQPRFSNRGRLAISPCDLARFGLLYQRDGNWRGKQLLTPEHVRQILTNPLPNAIPRTQNQRAEMIAEQRTLGGGSNQTDHMGSYSFAWWTNGVDREGQRHWPHAPEDAFAAVGHFGKRALVVMPSKDLIVVWNESKIQGREMEDRALDLLLRAIQPK